MPDKPKDIYELYKSARPHNALGFFADPQAGKQMAGDLTNALTRGALGVFGAPVDMLTMGARALGYGVPDDRVVGSSEWMGRQLENAGMLSKNRNQLAELLTGFVSPDPIDFAKMAAMAVPVVGRTAIASNAYLPKRFGDYAKADKDGNLLLFHGSRTPWNEMSFNLSRTGSQSGAATEGWGAYFATEKKNASRFGKNIYKLSLPKEITDRIIDFSKPLSEQSDFVKGILEKISPQTIDISDKETRSAVWRVANKLKEDLRYANRSEMQEGLYGVLKKTTGDDISDLVSWISKNDYKNKYYSRKILGLGDPTGWDIYENLSKLRNSQKLASNELSSYGIIGGNFKANRDLHSVIPDANNLVIWDQDVLNKYSKNN